MLQNKKRIAAFFVLIAIFIFTITFPLPYYIYKPGTADPLDPVVNIDGRYDSVGELHLVTVRGGRATPLQYLLGAIRPYHDIERLEEVFPEGYSREEYLQAQLRLMENSQEASTVVAYQAAEQSIDITYRGVYVVSVIPGMPAEEVLEIGDKIIAVDNQEVTDADNLIEIVNQKEAGDQILLSIEREDDHLDKYIELIAFPNNPEQVGIGIQLVTNREVNVEPSIEFSSGNIGGPSAGLMLALEIYDQLTEEDVTRGYQIAGTGEVTYQGDVLRIGGVDKKVVAAHNAGMDIFFVPFENDAPNSNYRLARETAEAIGTPMEIVAVDTFDDALDYLASLE
ncbi:PDZ domain-containing protein [Natronobacillus azotifigens]|uniref:endopeptidase La n=1 Tax=Natronobacillus azotifigens TaxID=472978 RepID=A0A9J6RE25_9BACI|nr:SepM family pheromone-processing serine protease [Natronobacillus azotifigens]MCZ0703994.1 PDZ domain-containing protein [Natronobacillus azotifigens]